MLPDAERVLLITGDVEGLTCLICVLGLFGLSNLHTRACFYGTQSCDFLISNRGGISSFGTLLTFYERCLLYVNGISTSSFTHHDTSC